jgi:hypothetical protein
MRRSILWVVAYGLAILSAIWACRYGFRAADTWLDSILRGAVLATVAIFAVHSFAWAYRVWHGGNKAVGFATGVVGLLCFLVTLAGGVGTSADTSDAKVGKRVAATDKREDSKLERARLIEERSRLGTPRPADAVRADILAAQTHQRYATSKACTDISRDDSRAHCKAYRALEGELAIAIRADELDEKLSRVRGELSQADVVGTADPQATRISVILRFMARIAPETIQAWLGLLTSIALEGAAWISMLLAEIGETRRREEKGAAATAPVADPIPVTPPTPPPPAPVRMLEHHPQPEIIEPEPVRGAEGVVAQFILETQESDHRGESELRDIYLAYLRWCRRSDYVPVLMPTFRDQLGRILTKGKRQARVDGEKLFYPGLRVPA